jgi:hypothetical protein
MSHTLTEAGDRLRRLLPLDLPPTVSVYLVGGYEVPIEFRCLSPGCLAYTKDALDLQLQPDLEALGRWTGRGFAAVVTNTGLLYSDPDVLMATLLHEAAHRWATPRSVLHRPYEEWPELVHFFAERPKPETPQRVEQEEKCRRDRPWELHEWKFIRAALHVEHRARGMGFEGHVSSIAGAQYGLSPVDAYREALADEPARLAGIPLFEAMLVAPPAALPALFDRDVEHYSAAGRGESPKSAFDLRDRRGHGDSERP